MSDLVMDFQYIRDTYAVPAAIGRRVVIDGKPGVIIKDCGQYIGVNFDKDNPGAISHCHPTWEVEYGDMVIIKNG